MQNHTPVSYFILSAYFNIGSLRWLVFCFLLMLYVLILVSNILLTGVIALNRSFHEPMYMFLCSLFINDLYGSSAIFPFLLLHILRDTHVVAASFCYLQVYVVHGYGSVELLNLVGMAYDRYLAICHPLHYKTRMSRNVMVALLIVPWMYGLWGIAVMIGMTSSLRQCGNVINKVYCDNYPLVKLACDDTTAVNIRGIVMTVIVVVFPLITIFYTYVCILKVCWTGSKRMRQKALATCSPHVASLLNFSFAGFFEIIQARFDMTHVPQMVRIFLSVYFLVCQPLLTPLIYGLVLTKIRLHCKDLVLKVFKKV